MTLALLVTLPLNQSAIPFSRQMQAQNQAALVSLVGSS